MKEGLLYPTLHRMQKDGLLRSEWGQSDSGRRRKYYAITPKGQEVLGEQTDEWQLFIKQLQTMMGNPRQTAEGEA
jgi:DNA-binding PadR family transcriptional regulator